MDFDMFFLEGDFGECICSGVFNLELSGGLWVPHINATGLQVDSILGIDIGGTYFGPSH